VARRANRADADAIGTCGLRAISFDPPGHGRRATTTDPWQYAAGVFGPFRRPRGIHGGDAGVALADLDRRISRICALIATGPDEAGSKPTLTGLPTLRCDFGRRGRAGSQRRRRNPGDESRECSHLGDGRHERLYETALSWLTASP
jgi:hypothetical protein